MLYGLIPYLLTFVFGITGSSLFFPNCEITLVAMTNIEQTPPFNFFNLMIDLSHYQARLPFMLAICMAAGSAIGSSAFYLMGTGSMKLSGRVKKKIESFDFSRLERAGAALIFVSAVSSIPPITPLAFAAGVIRYRFWEYVGVSFVGKVIRFTLVVYAGEGLMALIKHLF
ncbi:MAG: VTT domain-containing protein [bacterium]